MSCKQAIAGLLTILLCVMLLPRAGQAADWTVSPYRAQLASAPEDAPGVGGDTAVPVNPLKKNIGKGVLFSLIIPGTGQLYSGSWLRALPWFAVEVASWAVFASYHGQGQDKTEEFETFAGPRDAPNNFSYRAYMYHEYDVARDDILNGAAEPTTLSLQQWYSTSWETRAAHLPAPFTHDVLTTDQQQYYEMIGKYLLQFGWGWRDTYSGSSETPAFYLDDPATTDVIEGDNPNTVDFDGNSPLFFQYRDMRGEANDLLDKSNIAMEVVLVNHVLSALDAAFAVRSYNKRVAPTPAPDLGSLHLRYDARDIGDGQTARMLSLSVPLDTK